jgi:hypothetical protein
VCQALNALGLLARRQRHLDEAAAWLRESVAIARTVERPSDRAWVLVRALVLLGPVLCDLSDEQAAMVLLREALALVRDAGIRGNRLCLCLEGIAMVHGRVGDRLRATTLFAAANAEWRMSGHARFPDEDLGDQPVYALRAQLDAETFAEAWARGESMTVPQAVSGRSGRCQNGRFWRRCLRTLSVIRGYGAAVVSRGWD